MKTITVGDFLLTFLLAVRGNLFVRPIVLLIFLSNFSPVPAQNLVPDPSFEDILECPSGGKFEQLIFWSKGERTPDYMHACSDHPNFSVPNNWGGYLEPSSGDAYCALATYGALFFNTREHVISPLTAPLEVGTQYYVSLKTSLSLENEIAADYATNNLGVLFSTIQYDSLNTPPINDFSHVHAEEVITGDEEWTEIFGSFVADSSYQYLNIGNFYNDFNTAVTMMDTANSLSFAYYFIDDICVSKDSLTCKHYDHTITSLENTEASQVQLQVFPNPAQDFISLESPHAGQGGYSIHISDATGRVVYSTEKVLAESELQIDTSKLPRGLYLLRLQAVNGEVAVGKFQIE